ncbi:MAG: hypothetical protein JEY96_07655 [Bacteroidales bacterium]|nr:hypothetical protein [Bacteroidales bacterium]
MKKIVLSLVCIFSVGILFAQEGIDRYIVKSGYIEYELTGSSKGTKKIWWDDYGDKEREEIKSVSEVKIFGMVQKEEIHSIHISDGNKYWDINLLDGTAVMGTDSYYDAVDFSEDMTDAEKKKFEDDMLNAFGGEKLAPENFLGYKCEVIEVMGAKSWIYKTVVLKSTVNLMGIEVNEVAIKFDEDISIPASKFEPPSDIEFTENTYN